MHGDERLLCIINSDGGNEVSNVHSDDQTCTCNGDPARIRTAVHLLRLPECIQFIRFATIVSHGLTFTSGFIPAPLHTVLLVYDSGSPASNVLVSVFSVFNRISTHMKCVGEACSTQIYKKNMESERLHDAVHIALSHPHRVVRITQRVVFLLVVVLASSSGDSITSVYPAQVSQEGSCTNTVTEFSPTTSSFFAPRRSGVVFPNLGGWPAVFCTPASDSYKTKTAIRYAALGIPAGATITGAYATFVTEGVSFLGTACVQDTAGFAMVLHGQNAGNASVLTSNTGDISARPLTSAFARGNGAAFAGV